MKKMSNNKLFARAKAVLAASRMRKTSLKEGLSALSPKEIEEEIKAARKAKKKRKYQRA
jgi:hypothetical protein